MGHWPLLSCSAKPLPSEITGTCTGEVAAGWPKQRAEASKQCSMGGWRMPGEAKHSLYSSSTEEQGSAAPTLLNPPSPRSLLPTSKVAFSVDKPQNLILFENFFFLLLNKRWIEEYLN